MMVSQPSSPPEGYAMLFAVADTASWGAGKKRVTRYMKLS